MATLTSALRKELRLPLGVSGALITEVVSSSAADGAGLKAGMVIYSIDHRAVTAKEDLLSRLRGKEAGAQFLFGVWRKSGSEWQRSSKTVPVAAQSANGSSSRSSTK